MRFRIPLVVMLACSVAWLGCDEQTGVDSVQGPAPSFAPGGPTPDACDLKGLPLRDYFPKADLKYVTNLVRDLSDACAVGDQETAEVGALAKGFSILEEVEAADKAGATDYGAGGQIVAGVWAAMQYNGGVGVACTLCAEADVGEAVVAEALGLGAFGVRGGSDGYVASLGEYPDIWGIEPDGDAWVLPLDKALIYGVPLYLDEPGLGGETPLTFGYNWNVVAWWANPTVETEPLLVGTCATSTGANVPLVSHEPEEGDPTLLPFKSGTPGYCGTEGSLGSRLLNLASLAVPLWPQPLNATAMVGVSGSGKAREFSPFHQYDVAPYAAVTIEPLPDDGFVRDELCTDGPCTTVTWVTEQGSTIASRETLRFTTEANSSSWADVKICVKPVDAGGNPIQVLNPDNDKYEDIVYCTDYTDPQNPQPPEAVCDGRETLKNPCKGLAVTSFVSDKTGSHRICVNDVGGVGSSGLIFEQCTATFNIRP